MTASGKSKKLTPKSSSNPGISSVLEPTRFLADIFLLRPTLIGEWVVAQYAVNDIGEPLINDFSFTGRDHESVQGFNDATRLRGSAAKAVEILDRGSFRQAHWVRAKAALSSGIPNEVKAAIREFQLSEDKKIYVARAEQLRLDLDLLACLAQLTTALQKERWSEVKKQIERGRRLFSSVRVMDSIPQDPGGSLDFDGEHTESTPQVRRREIPKRKPDIGAGAQKAEANKLFADAFDRGLGTMEAKYWSRGPGLQLRTSSLQTALYLTVLANSHSDWQECKLPGCSGIFQRRNKKNKDYCGWNCAHKATMRSKRARQKAERDKG
jgi:hypothetical protein